MIEVVKEEGQLRQALSIRRCVFCEEQQIDPAIEVDEYDSLAVPNSLHLLVFHQGQALGTGRLVWEGERGKLGRMAVLPQARGLGLGSLLVMGLLEQARGLGLREAYVHAQVQAQPFYAKMGFIPQGEEFLEAEILHVEMIQPL